MGPIYKVPIHRVPIYRAPTYRSVYRGPTWELYIGLHYAGPLYIGPSIYTAQINVIVNVAGSIWYWLSRLCSPVLPMCAPICPARFFPGGVSGLLHMLCPGFNGFRDVLCFRGSLVLEMLLFYNCLGFCWIHDFICFLSVLVVVFLYL